MFVMIPARPRDIKPSDEDLSGCLASGFLKPKKTMPVVPKRNLPKPTVNELETDDAPASDWFYLN
jgi:hypothetical protein